MPATVFLKLRGSLTHYDLPLEKNVARSLCGRVSSRTVWSAFFYLSRGTAASLVDGVVYSLRRLRLLLTPDAVAIGFYV